MKSKLVGSIILSSALIIFSSMAYAKDDRLQFPISDAINSADAKTKLSADVTFYFGPQAHGSVEKDFGFVTSNKKTNAFNKTDKAACERAFLSALISLHDRAIKEGGNAVVEIYNEYRNQKFTSETEYECGSGNVIAGVTLRGKVVKLAE